MTTRIQLGRKKGYRVEAGHPWVYDNEIDTVSGDIHEGSVADIFNFKGYFIGKGICNPNSHIRVRLFTRNPDETVDAALFKRRIHAAWNLRHSIGYTENCRVIFSEADFLSGLIVDKFGDVLVIQIQSLAVETFKDAVIATLKEIFNPRGIFERNDVPIRELEGLELRKGFITAPFETEVVITEPDGLKFLVDIANGQKTGFFLDQKENRRAIAPFVKGADVLDCFCYTGSFSLYAARYGAKHVLGLDQSETAVQLSRRNAKLNGFTGVCEFSSENAFDALNTWSRDRRLFDVVLLDPPAFTKSRANIEGAVRGYKDINLRAMQILKPGGFLITCSCSHFVHPELLQAVIFEAARDAHKTVRQVLYQTQAKDHPVLWGVEESLYLKFFVLQVS